MGMLTHHVIEEMVQELHDEVTSLGVEYAAAKETLAAKFEMRPVEAIHEMTMLTVRASKISSLAGHLHSGIDSARNGAIQKLNIERAAHG